MSKIKIEGMQFYAYHGCFPEERLVGTHFVVDCSLAVDIRAAALADDLKLTINYQEVYQVIAKEMEKPSFLLENVAYRILNSLHDCFPMLEKAGISVKKMNPPLGGKIDNVSVSMSSGGVIRKCRTRKNHKNLIV